MLKPRHSVVSSSEYIHLPDPNSENEAQHKNLNNKTHSTITESVCDYLSTTSRIIQCVSSSLDHNH